MDPNVSPAAGQTDATDDSLESLGLKGPSLMRLWGAGIELVSELTQHNIDSLRKLLRGSSGGTARDNEHIDALLEDVSDALKRRNGKSDAPAQVESIDEYRRKLVADDDGDASEHVAADTANAEAPEYGNNPLGLLPHAMRKYPILSREAQIELARRFREEGDEQARELLITHNLRLVLPTARKHLWSQLEFADLVQEGIIGLMIAIEKFDHTQGNALSTYALWWIRQAIGRYVQDFGGVIRIPVHMQELVLKIRNTMNELAQATGRPPSLGEVAKVLEIEPKKVKRALKVARMEVGSLDEKVSPKNDTDGDATLHQLIADKGALRGEHVLEARQELNAACARVNRLAEAVYDDESISERNCEVFVRFYGLEGSLQKRTLEVTAEKYDLTRERVRQIIVRVWRKLQAAGHDSDHDDLLGELRRIAALEKLANQPVSVH